MYVYVHVYAYDFDGVGGAPCFYDVSYVFDGIDGFGGLDGAPCFYFARTAAAVGVTAARRRRRW